MRNYVFFALLLTSLIACKEDPPAPVVQYEPGTFKAQFESDFNYIYYEGQARYSIETDQDGFERISLSLIDDDNPSDWIKADITLHPAGPVLDTTWYYFKTTEATVDSPMVEMALRYQNYIFDIHKDLNFGIVYTSHVRLQRLEDGLIKGFLDAHLECGGCPLLPYLIGARFDAIPE